MVPSPSDGHREPGPRLQTLPNGAGLVVAPMEARESVAISLLVRVGSRWEPARLAGVSHFLEHIVFKGTERFPTSRAVSESIEGIGGVLNASTDKEVTAFWAKVPAAHLELGLRVLFDLAFAPRIEPGETERERQVVLDELHMYLDQPSDLVQMLFDSLIWGSHSLARDPAGTAASLRRIGAAELEAYRGTFYRADRVVVVLAGAVDARAGRASVERAFADQYRPVPAPAMRRSDGGAPALGPAGPTARARRRRGEQVHLLLGMRCSSYLDPERWTLDLLNAALGEGMSSRLFLRLREDQALAYDVHSFVSRHRDTGAFAVYLATGPERVRTAVRSALEQLGLMADQGIGEEELERTKAQLEGRLRLQLESTGAMAEFLGHQALLVGEVTSREEEIAAIRAVSAADVRALAARMFRSASWRLAAVGPEVDGAALGSLLDDGVVAIRTGQLVRLAS